MCQVLLREQLAVCCNTCWLLRWKSGRAGRLLPNRRDPAAAPERELGEVLRQRAKRGGEPQAGPTGERGGGGQVLPGWDGVPRWLLPVWAGLVLLC